jgi:predicted NBD/HSP70 family sugar kinase
MTMPHSQLRTLMNQQMGATAAARVVQTLGEHGTLSATQIARITGLAKSTISAALSSLRASDMVIEVPSAVRDRSVGAGRPAISITLNPAVGTCVGVLLGGEHIQVILADVTHTVISDASKPMAFDYTPDEAVATASAMIWEAYRSRDLSLETMLGIGIAVAGPINPRDGKILRASGVPTWTGVNIADEFKRVLGCPVIAENESNCSAVAELMWGVATGYEDFVFLTMDVAVGGAVVSRGQLLSGHAGAAGEFGHICVDPNGAQCRCGKRGCLELYAGLEEPLARYTSESRQQLTIAEVVSRALEGDQSCRAMIAEVARVAGHGLGIVSSVIDPGLVVVGGRLAMAGELLLSPLRTSYQKHSLVRQSGPEVDTDTLVLGSAFSGRGACLGAVGMVLRNCGRSG